MSFTYQIDPAHSSAHFSVRHMMIANVRGEFSKLSGTVEYDAANPAAAQVEASIDAATINTREPQRDAHLRSADFFDVEKFPAITFASTGLQGSNGDLKLAGNLTIHGVTKPVLLDIDGPTPEQKDPWGNLRIGATATGKLNRKDFGLTWNTALEAGGVLVGEDVKLTLDIQAIRQQ